MSILKYATISPCGTYRYVLGREWTNAPLAVFVMLNPSTADADVDDPTIRRCMGFARAWGNGGIRVVNLFAYRSTDPDALASLPIDVAIGPDNDAHIRAALGMTYATVVTAWGAHAAASRSRRDEDVLHIIAKSKHEAYYLRRTKSGAPCHPLYLPSSLTPRSR